MRVQLEIQAGSTLAIILFSTTQSGTRETAALEKAQHYKAMQQIYQTSA